MFYDLIAATTLFLKKQNIVEGLLDSRKIN